MGSNLNLPRINIYVFRFNFAASSLVVFGRSSFRRNFGNLNLGLSTRYNSNKLLKDKEEGEEESKKEEKKELESKEDVENSTSRIKRSKDTGSNEKKKKKETEKEKKDRRIDRKD
jgi:hypothetical protein